jgi:NhaP-type Na+/H+ or K+/H+ antiporter
MDRRTWVFIAAGALLVKLVERILEVDLGRLAVNLIVDAGSGLVIGGVLGLVVARLTRRRQLQVTTSSASGRPA